MDGPSVPIMFLPKWQSLFCPPFLQEGLPILIITASSDPASVSCCVSIERDRDIFPPATIGDLVVTYGGDELELIASWTAPVGDHNDAGVSGYHLVYSASLTACCCL